MVEALDLAFGVTRGPEKIDVWELDQKPLSLTMLNEAVGQILRELEVLAQSSLLGFAMRSMNYIWAMTEDGTIWIAMEELAFLDEFPHQGYPRRRSCQHPSDQKKLGHPTLVDGGDVRIAGELAFDETERGGLAWIINMNSGRYCRQMPPSPQQLDAVAAKFGELGITAKVDYD